MTQRAIVLAAGRGSRLVSGEDFPKPLKSIAGVPLLVRILRTLQGEGIHEAVIVVGYRGDEIRDALCREPSLALRMTFVENPDFDKKNGVSLLAARDYVQGPCVLTMADHLYSPEVVRRLRAFDAPAGSCVLAVDHDVDRCFDIDDATKVALDGTRVANIGKELEHYDVLDTGVFLVGPALVRELERFRAETGDASLSDGVAALASRGAMYACSIGDARWIDVDTPEAAQRAEAMLHVFGERLGDEPGGARLAPEAIEMFAPSWVRAANPYNEEHFAVAEGAVAEGRSVARLMSNESPFRPSERVVQAIVTAALEGNLYPGRARELRARLGEREGLDVDHVILGAGSAELIDLAIRSFVAPGEEVLLSVPTFSMYEARTRTVGGIPVMVPVTADGDFDVPGLIGAITERTKLLFLCTPNNPTGNRLDEGRVRRILELGLPTVIDEAYQEFSEDGATFAHLVHEFPNALVLRTFSKAFGLAGMRIGYGLGHPAHIRLLSRVKVPWNLAAPAIAAALATLDDVEEQALRVAQLQAGRQYLVRELSRLPGVRVLPSDGNFVMVDAAGTRLSSEDIVDGMLDDGIFIRSLRSHHEIQILIECKKIGESLSLNHASQLFRYFHVTNARIAILTNGKIYKFFTDLDAPNKMDEKPFLELDLLDIDEHVVPELLKLTKSAFDVESIVSAAGELKYVSQIKKLLTGLLTSPDEDFIKFVASRVYEGAVTQKVRELFSELTRKASAQFLNDQANDRLKSAISGSPASVVQSKEPALSPAEPEAEAGEKIVTTEEEIEGFMIVKAIVRHAVDVKRVAVRDNQSYCGVLIDDNNRKPICRLHFNRSQKYLGVFDQDKNETRIPINGVDDIYAHSEKLIETTKFYL